MIFFAILPVARQKNYINLYYRHILKSYSTVQRLTFKGLNWLQTLPKNPRWLTTGCERSNMAVMHLCCTWNAEHAVNLCISDTKNSDPKVQCFTGEGNKVNKFASTDPVRFNLRLFGTADFFAEVPCQLCGMVQVVPPASTASIVSQNSTWKKNSSTIQPMESINIKPKQLLCVWIMNADSIDLHKAASVENSPLLPWYLER